MSSIDNDKEDVLNLESDDSNSSEIFMDKKRNKDYNRMLIEFQKVEGTYRPPMPTSIPLMTPSVDWSVKNNNNKSSYLFDFDRDFDLVEEKDEFAEALCYLSVPRLVVFRNEIVLFYLAPDKNNSSFGYYKKGEISDFSLIFKSFLKGNVFSIPFTRFLKCIQTKENSFSISYSGKGSFNTLTEGVSTKFEEQCEQIVEAINTVKNY